VLTLSGGREFSRIAAIVEALGDRGEGIGDDCAELPRGEHPALWTIDTQVEGVHFRREWLSWRDVGFRATVAAASDVLAMGGVVERIVVGWTIPACEEAASDEWLLEIAKGQREACIALDAKIVGGNLSAGPSLSLTTSVLGSAARSVRRTGARIGDRIVMAGPVGHAAAGLAWLQRGLDERDGERWVAAWRRPPVLRSASRFIAAHAHAGIDVSDGLAQDVGHLAEASQVRVELDGAAIERASFAASERARLEAEGLDPMALSLGGGEDYALVAAVGEDVPIPQEFVEIGKVVAGAGVAVVRADGTAYPPPRGFSHR